MNVFLANDTFEDTINFDIQITISLLKFNYI